MVEHVNIANPLKVSEFRFWKHNDQTTKLVQTSSLLLSDSKDKEAEEENNNTAVSKYLLT